MGLIYHAALENSNNVFNGFSSVKSATSGIFPVSRREKMKSTIFTNRLVTTNRDSPRFSIPDWGGKFIPPARNGE